MAYSLAQMELLGERFLALIKQYYHEILVSINLEKEKNTVRYCHFDLRYITRLEGKLI